MRIKTVMALFLISTVTVPIQCIAIVVGKCGRKEIIVLLLSDKRQKE